MPHLELAIEIGQSQSGARPAASAKRHKDQRQRRPRRLISHTMPYQKHALRGCRYFRASYLSMCYCLCNLIADGAPMQSQVLLIYKKHDDGKKHTILVFLCKML